MENLINRITPQGRADREARDFVDETIPGYSAEVKDVQRSEFSRRLRQRHEMAVLRLSGLLVSATSLTGLYEQAIQDGTLPNLFVHFGEQARFIPELASRLPTETLIVFSLLGFAVGYLATKNLRYFQGRVDQMRDSLLDANLQTGKPEESKHPRKKPYRGRGL